MLSRSAKDCYETPDAIFNHFDNLYHFVLDAAADQTNHKCPAYFGPGGIYEDALEVVWPLDEGSIWCNPPYSRGFQRNFVEKALEEANRPTNFLSPHRIVMLLPADTSTALFHDLICDLDHHFLRGRLRFKGAPGPAKFGSLVVII